MLGVAHYPRLRDYSRPHPRPVPRINDSNPVIEDVEAAFTQIRTKGEYLSAWDGAHIPWPRYTANIDNTFGFNNHFQGIQRLSKNYVVISGGDPHEPMSHLFVVKMGSRPEKGGWRSNKIATGRPADADEVVKRVDIDAKMWHAGGISVCGDLLAVPVYGGDPVHCRIAFYNMQDPENPERMTVSIERPGVRAGAVALTKLPSGHFLVGVWCDNDALPNRIDFYLSNTTNILDGFRKKYVSWHASKVKAGNGQKPTFDHFQNINFINRSDGVLFLLGTHNTSSSAPTMPGEDFADLYEIRFPANTVMSRRGPVLAMPTVTKVANKQFYCNDMQANMDAAAGVYIEPSGLLRLYAAYHWCSDSVIKFNEYRPVPDVRKSHISDLKEAWVDLYEHDHFRGRCLSLKGAAFSNFRNYGRISVQGGAFNDLASSVRFQIPRGVTYRLFEHCNYKGRYLDLTGTGTRKQLRDFKYLDFGDRVSSSRYVMNA